MHKWLVDVDGDAVGVANEILVLAEFDAVNLDVLDYTYDTVTVVSEEPVYRVVQVLDELRLRYERLT